MAQHQPILCPQAVWTKLTNALITTDISVAVLDGSVEVTGTVGTTPPPVANEGLPLVGLGAGWSEATLEKKFPGVVGADTLWARPIHCVQAARVFVSHG